MPSSNDRSGECGETRSLRARAPAAAEGVPGRASRRALLVLGGVLAGGRSVLASSAPDVSEQARTTAQARVKLAQTAIEIARANTRRGLLKPGERDPIAIWSRRRFEARL